MQLNRTHLFGFAALAAMFLFGAVAARLAQPGHFTDLDCSTGVPGPFTSATVHFIGTVQARTDLAIGGRPIEGYEPSMLMRAYPGIRPTDFVCVQAAGGWYDPRADGTLALVPTRQNGDRTSADGAITPHGLAKLLENLRHAHALPVATPQDVDTLLQALAPVPASQGEPQRATLEGEYVCLPHKNTTGPQTMECAFGIRTVDGSYYALDLGPLSAAPPALQIGDRLRANGIVTPIERLSSDRWQAYSVKGIFSVTDSLEIR